MRRDVLLLMAGVSFFAPRDASAHTVDLIDAQHSAFATSPVELEPEIVLAILRVLGHDLVEQVLDDIVNVSGGAMQPDPASGSGGGSVSPSALASSAVDQIPVLPVVGRILESRILIPVLFLDGIFRPPQR